MKIHLCHIRLTGYDKTYYLAQLKLFASFFDEKKVKSISFGKQDIRGSNSITLVDNNRCVPLQKHFTNKWEMLGFVVGFNQAHEKWRFKEFLK